MNAASVNDLSCCFWSEFLAVIESFLPSFQGVLSAHYHLISSDFDLDCQTYDFERWSYIRKDQGDFKISWVSLREWMIKLPIMGESNNAIYHEPPKPWKNKGFGHLKTKLFTIKTSKNVGLGENHGNRWFWWWPFLGWWTRDTWQMVVGHLQLRDFPSTLCLVWHGVV